MFVILQSCPIYLSSPLLGYVIFRELLHLFIPSFTNAYYVICPVLDTVNQRGMRQVPAMRELTGYSVVGKIGVEVWVRVQHKCWEKDP